MYSDPVLISLPWLVIITFGPYPLHRTEFYLLRAHIFRMGVSWVIDVHSQNRKYLVRLRWYGKAKTDKNNGQGRQFYWSNKYYRLCNL